MSNDRYTLQESMDLYLRKLQRSSSDTAKAEASAERCFELLVQYLIHYSDLFQDREFADEEEFSEWEEQLESHMVDLLEGDVEPSGDLGNLPLSALDAEHLRDFLAWFVVRESCDIALIQAYAAHLLAWVEYVHRDGGWQQEQYISLIEAMAEATPAAERVARVASVLFLFVRSGGGTPPRLRGKRFQRFVEGHGRVTKIDEQGLMLDFESQNALVGPICLPQAILQMIEVGDIFDVELGLRGDSWVMVDIGPVYPSCVYVEVEAYEGLKKLS